MRSKVDLRALTLVAFLALLVAIPVGVLGVTSDTVVKGKVTTPDPVSLSSNAIAVITLVDRSARGGSGVILGQKRLVNPGTTPIGFSVRYDAKRIKQDHSYVLFAAVIDGNKRWQNPDGVPVITGGPTSGVDVRVKKVSTDPIATIPGEITKKDKTALTGRAVALAAVLDLDTGRTVSWTAITPSGNVPIEFTLGYDPATLNTGGNLVSWAGIVDGTSVWESTSAGPLIAAGPNLSAGSISVTPATALPTAPEATPTPTPKPTPTPVTVPSVRNQPEAQAIDTIEAADLNVDQTARNYNANVAKGNAVKTSPEAGVKVKPGSGVKLVVSKGPSPSPSPTPTPKPTAKPTPTPSPTPKPVTVPDVRGQAEADAVITLTDAGLKIGARPKRFNDKVPAGAAIKTDPAAGTKVKPGSAVDLYVSKGPEPSPSPSPSPSVTPKPVTVPDVRGMTEADGVVELSDAGLKVGDRNKRDNASVPAGSIIKTAPEGGAKVAPGSRIDLFVSTGPLPTTQPTARPVTVPDVSGLSEADAIIALTDVNLEIGERAREVDPAVPADVVILTVPEAGEQVSQGTFVDLVVSDGPAATPTPTPEPSRTPLPSGSPEPSPSIAPWPYPTDGIGILSGTLIYRDTTTPTPQRHVVITLLEEGTFGTRVVPIEQFVDDGAPPQGFVVTFDWAEIDPLARYRVLAAVVDGGSAWYTQDGAAAITWGAPISGLLVPLFQRGDLLEGQVTGVIVGVDADLSAAATREAFLVRGDTGAVVAYDAGPASTASRVQVFTIPFLLEDIDEAVPYLVVARVIDGPRIWTGPGVPVVTLGAPFKVVVEVSPLVGPEQALDAPDP